MDAGTFGGRRYGASMNVLDTTVVARQFVVLEILLACLPGRMDGLMARIVGDRYASGARNRLRLRWIRINGLMLLVFSALIYLTLPGRP